MCFKKTKNDGFLECTSCMISDIVQFIFRDKYMHMYWNVPSIPSRYHIFMTNISRHTQCLHPHFLFESAIVWSKSGNMFSKKKPKAFGGKSVLKPVLT